MTLVILALDALDPATVEYYGIDEFKLDNYQKMETYCNYWEDRPHTGEVWPTVATGLHAEEHGVTGAAEAEWNKWYVNLISRLTTWLPQSVRNDLGDVAEDTFGADWDLAETDADSFLDGENVEVHNWPGVENSDAIRKLWDRVNLAEQSEEPQETFDRDLLATAAGKFGWLDEMVKYNVDIVACHVHVLDLTGHVYGYDEENYRRFYDWAADRVSQLRENMKEGDDLLILSDHGMCVEWIDNRESARGHSMRAFVSSTIEDPLPESVFDVKDWVESHKHDESREHTEMDLPTQRLRELGYIE